MKKILVTLFLILGLASPCFSAGELTSYNKQKFLGLNTRLNPKLLPDEESPDLSNITLEEAGSITERDVFGQYNTSSGALGSNYVTGLFKFYTATAKYFVGCAGNKIANGASGVWTDITQAGLAVTPGTYWSAITFNNELYLFNNSVAMQNWAGTGLTTTPADYPTTNCSYAAVHKARVWAAGSASLPYRLYMSALNNAESWTDTVDLPDMTQKITGLVSWGGYLFIFTETNIYRLIGSTTTDFRLEKTNSQVGAIAPRTIQISDIGIIFLARTGLFAFDGNNANKLSDKVESLINGISKTAISSACGIYDEQNRYWLSYAIQGSSYNNKIMIYDTILKEWYKYDNLNISYFVKASSGMDKGELYGGSAISNGIVWILQSATGTESISHTTEANFNDGVTSNTIIPNTPSVNIKSVDNALMPSSNKLLIHFNSTDGAVTYTTEDWKSRAVTFVNAQIDTAYYMFRRSKEGSLLCNGGGVQATVADDATDFNMGTGNFTFDFWVRFNSLTNGQMIFNKGGDDLTFWYIYKDTSANGNKLTFSASSGGVTKAYYVMTNAWSVTTGVWHHLSFVRNGTTMLIFIDGVSQVLTESTAFGANALPNNNESLRIGSKWSGVFPVDGWIDEIRWDNVARYTSNFTPYSSEYPYSITNGTLTSQPAQINASNTSTLDVISWTDTLPTNTKVSFQTRTGATNDTVAYAGWQYWSSDNTATFDTVTHNTVWTSTDNTNFDKNRPKVAQPRNIQFFEDENNGSPTCVQFYCSGVGALNDSASQTLPIKNISTYDWLGVWSKCPETGNTIEYAFGERTNRDNVMTINTVVANTWQKSYFYIGGITSTDRDAVSQMSVKYKGITAGNLYIGESSTYEFYTNGDVMTSNPNDYLQYKAILGTGDVTQTPQLNSVTLSYSPALSVEETSLATYYYTKWIDFGSPQVNKQFLDFFVDVYNSEDSSTATTTLYCDYDIDDGIKTGTISMTTSTTGNTVQFKKYFPGSTYGKTMRLKFYHSDKNAKLTIRSCQVRFRQEGFN